MDSGTGAELGDEAIDWMVRLHSGRATAEDRRAFAAWRRRSPAHEIAARRAETLWREIGETPTARAFQAGAAEVVAMPPSRTWTPSRRAMLTGSVAASVVALAVASGVLGPVSGWFADYATRIGERRDVRLPDGSTAHLNTGSALSVAYGATERRLSLGAGEAVFEVARDPTRPFVLAAADGEARALGTVFGVRRDGAAVGVTVSAGQVEVRLGDGPDEARRVAAGQAVSYGAGRFLTEVRDVDVGAAMAWRRGKLIFNQRPLADVAAELERYQTGRIVVAEARLRAMPVTGVFDLNDPDGTLQTIERTLPVKALRLPLLTILR